MVYSITSYRDKKIILYRRVMEMTLIDHHLWRIIMLEKRIEQRLRDEVKRRGGLALKFVSPGFAGVPDRLVLMPDGNVGFVEIKAPGEVPRPIQLSRHKLLRQLGFKVYVLDNIENITHIIDEIERGEDL